MQAVIMAGGKGTRLHAVTKDTIPKPMVPVLGKPLLQWQIEKLRDNGITDIFIITGHLGHVIREYFQDGSKYGVSIKFYEECEPLGTAGALYEIKEGLEEKFFLVFGDVLFDVDLDRMRKIHEKKHADATLFVHPNTHPADSDLVILDGENQMIRFEAKGGRRNYWYSNCVNAGLYLLSKKILDGSRRSRKLDLEKDLLSGLCSRQQRVYAYRSSEYVKDIGTPERITAAAAELAGGSVEARNLKKKQRAVFLDRDSTLNQKSGANDSTRQFELAVSAAEAVRMLNQSGYLVIVTAYQPPASGGPCDISKISRIHQKMETLLGEKGAYADDIYLCPPDPHNDIINKYNIDLPASWIVHGSAAGIQLGKAAGGKTALVLTRDAGCEETYAVEPDIVGKDLLSIVEQILAGKEVCR